MGNTGLFALGICRLPVKARDKIRLFQFFSSKTDAVFFASSEVDIAGIIGHPVQTAFSMDNIRALAEKDAELSEKLHIHYVSWEESAYPPLLREIYDPPVVLFYRGNLPDPEIPLVAMVGTRSPSGAASTAAFNIAREFGSLGYSVVSGLALGIDAMSHRGCLEAGAPTFAVLGSSPDEVYPGANRDLARRTLAAGGGLLSEYPPGTHPAKWRFPARNRIISALARGTLIVEAPEKSGALITARFALEQNRDVWVTRTGVESPLGKGTANLVEQGVKAVTSAVEILSEWGRAVEKPPQDTLCAHKRGEELFSPEDLASELASELGQT
jgi:DNA processing protein